MQKRQNHKILIVDDDPTFHNQVRSNMGRYYTFEGARDLSGMFQKLEEHNTIELILLDVELKTPSGTEEFGLDALPKLADQYPEIPVFIVTNDAKAPALVVQAMKQGAKDYLEKNWGEINFDLWDEKFRQAIEDNKTKKEVKELRREVTRLRKQETADFPFIGETKKVKEIKSILKSLGESPDITLLITGETGTGKEVAARYLHFHSLRNQKPFVPVNLSAVQQSLLESELFGHIKGAFTGASQSKEGYFRQADKGILLLDEIGDISEDIQVKLLRFLEQKVIRPVGSDKDIQLDIQIITATHRDLPARVRAGHFRQDLYMRLRQYEIVLPPLRERREDIPLIIAHYLNQKGLDVHTIQNEALDKLLNYPWEGNIRELVNAISQMLVNQRVNNVQQLNVSCLPKDIQEYIPGRQTVFTAPRAATNHVPTEQFSDLSREEAIAAVELKRINEALIQTNYRKGEAAEMVGMVNTDKLRYCIKKHYKNHPDLVAGFPGIVRAFPKIVK